MPDLTTETRRKVKVYAVESNSGFINTEEARLLGEQPWIRQGRILVSACNKTEALAVLEATGHRQSTSSVRVGMGNDVDALTDGEVFTGPGVVILTRMSGGDSPVVRVVSRTDREVIGQLRRNQDSLTKSYEPTTPEETP